MKETESAIAVYEELVKKNPRYDPAANNLASLLTDHRTDKQSLEQAVKLAYEELGQHMKEKNWLPMAWALADEPLIHGISADTVIKVFGQCLSAGAWLLQG
jgi:hypothetical protein